MSTSLEFGTPIYKLLASGKKFDGIQEELLNVYNQTTFKHLDYAPDAHNVSVDMDGNYFRGCILTAYKCEKFLKFLDYGIKNYVHTISNESWEKPSTNSIEWKNADDYTITESWFTKTLKGQYAPVHMHGDSDISGVYYIDTNGEDGELKMRSPYEMFVGNYIYSMMDRGSEANVPLRNGQLALWPYILHHSTNPNNTDHERISLSFNLTFSRQGTSIQSGHYHKFFIDKFQYKDQ